MICHHFRYGTALYDPAGQDGYITCEIRSGNVGKMNCWTKEFQTWFGFVVVIYLHLEIMAQQINAYRTLFLGCLGHFKMIIQEWGR